MEQCDIVVIGAGFAGMYAIHRLRKQYSVVCFEAGDGVGGTWYWNRYPGARVDVESVQYSYGFDNDLQQEWSWPEHFSAQPDLERYANHVAEVSSCANSSGSLMPCSRCASTKPRIAGMCTARRAIM